MTYRERRERRAERLREWADKRETKSTQAYEASNAIVEGIPFGQPILVGHHSESRHRRDIGRVHRLMDASVEHQRKAEDMNERASTIERQLDQSIYSDDPDAIERLRERIADLEAQRDRIKAYNASCRKGARNVDLLDPKQQQDLAGIAKHASYQLGKRGEYPSYALSNLGGNIKRNRDRLARLERQAARAS
jgi:hypothetical protein